MLLQNRIEKPNNISKIGKSGIQKTEVGHGRSIGIILDKLEKKISPPQNQPKNRLSGCYKTSKKYFCSTFIGYLERLFFKPSQTVTRRAAKTRPLW